MCMNLYCLKCGASDHSTQHCPAAAIKAAGFEKSTNRPSSVPCGKCGRPWYRHYVRKTGRIRQVWCEECILKEIEK